MNQYAICTSLIFVAMASVYMVFGAKIPPQNSLLIVGSALFSWLATLFIIPKLIPFMLQKKIFGLDINKKGSKGGQKQIPQCIGFASSTTYVLAVFVLCLFFNQKQLLSHVSCSLTIIGTILLGFADDMLDLPWRYKLIFPFFIVLPSVVAYQGSTSIFIPYPFSIIIGHSLNLGVLYFVYLTLLGIYCTNAINIYAGINGLQVGQSIVVAAMQLMLYSMRAYKNGSHEKYFYSILILVVFLGSALGLMKFNAYPSKVFVGDTFCYYAGITIAISAMLSETAIVFHFLFIPQLINFLYSVPQLFGFYFCPRHRLTQYLVDKDVLRAKPENMNLLNLSLRILGPTNQGKLCNKLLYFQIFCGSISLVLTFFNII